MSRRRGRDDGKYGADAGEAENQDAEDTDAKDVPRTMLVDR